MARLCLDIFRAAQNSLQLEYRNGNDPELLKAAVEVLHTTMLCLTARGLTATDLEVVLLDWAKDKTRQPLMGGKHESVGFRAESTELGGMLVLGSDENDATFEPPPDRIRDSNEGGNPDEVNPGPIREPKKRLSRLPKE